MYTNKKRKYDKILAGGGYEYNKKKIIIFIDKYTKINENNLQEFIDEFESIYKHELIHAKQNNHETVTQLDDKTYYSRENEIEAQANDAIQVLVKDYDIDEIGDMVVDELENNHSLHITEHLYEVNNTSKIYHEIGGIIYKKFLTYMLKYLELQ